MLRVCKLLASMVQKVEQSLLLLVTVQATDLSLRLTIRYDTIVCI